MHLRLHKNAEFYSSNFYLQMSAWAECKGFPGAAKFLKAHAAEEMEHMQRLFTYLCETGAMPEIGSIAAPKTEYASLKDLFEEVDLPPASRTKLKLVKSVNHQENDGHEEEQIHRGTDHRLPQAGRGRHADQGAVPQWRFQ